MELVDYMYDPNSAKILTEANMPQIIQMISKNIFRTFPSRYLKKREEQRNKREGKRKLERERERQETR